MVGMPLKLDGTMMANLWFMYGERLLRKWLRHGEMGCFYKEEMVNMWLIYGSTMVIIGLYIDVELVVRVW